jgi:tripartite-type tricarboxylate transporter receptor subunit TctC
MTKPPTCFFNFAAAIASVFLSASALAQAPAAAAYPNKPARIIVPFSAGGASDVMGRLLAKKLADLWGRGVVVENRAGAGGNIGMEYVARSAPDGYTLVLMNNAAASNAALNSRMSFDVLKDFESIGLVASTPMVLVANTRVPAKNLNDLTKLLKSSPGKYSYGSCGLGGPQHFATELYKYRTGAFMVHIPYRGCSQSVADILGGQLELAMVSSTVAIAQAKSGKLVALATTAPRRLAAAPEIPTFRESGIPALKDYEFDIWYGLMVPAGTPRTVVAKITADLATVMNQTDTRQSMAAAGIDLLTGSGEELKKLYLSDLEKSQIVVKFANLKVE